MAIITVNGKQIEVIENALLIEELLKNGIKVPHFCYHPALGKDGNCRMCMVEIVGKKRPQISCDTPVRDGMIVNTKGEMIDEVKRAILELELINHPIDCPICDQAGECELQNYYMQVGLHESRLNTPKVTGKKHVDLGANVVLDQDRCVMCTRCVRFTRDITKTHELGVLSRADHAVIATFPGRPLANPYAMNVVDLCPVGALTSKDFRFHKRVWFLKPERAICNRCAKGCSIFVDHHKAKYENDSIFRYRPRFNPQVNGYFICDVGRLSYKTENQNSQSQPMIRESLSDFEYTQSKLHRLLKRHQDKILFLISPSLSLEEMVRLQKMAQRYGASMSGYDVLEYDANFGDDYLRSNDLSTNRRALSLLGIDESLENLAAYAQKAEFALLVGRDDFESIAGFESIKAKAVLGPKTPKKDIILDLYLPTLTHTSKQGSYINIDGYLQFSKAHVENPQGTLSLLQVIESFMQDNITTCADVWEDSLQDILKSVSFNDIQNQSIKMS